jgi:hypothetical protein
VVAVPVSVQVEPGRYDLTWHATGRDGRTVAPGVYFCRLFNFDAGEASTQKLTLMR